MYPTFNKTPCILSVPLSEQLHKNVYLKLENLQPSGSFKDRGIGNLCQHLATNGSKGFICSSGGNAGLSVAYAAKRLNLDATIVVPITTPPHMLKTLRGTQATIIEHGDNFNEAEALASQKAKDLSLDYISPFNHPKIWEGYQTIPEEIKTIGIKPDAIVLSVGGGGLLTGVLQGLENIGWQDVAVITAETEGAATLAESIKQHKRVYLDKIDTIAKSLGAKQVAEQAFLLAQKQKVIPQVMSDKATVSACINFAYDHKVLVEPACGASLAVAYDNFDVLKNYQTLCIIVCGGNGISCNSLNQWRADFKL